MVRHIRVAMSTSDFCVKIECGEEQKQTTLFFRFAEKPGGTPILCGVDSEFSEVSVEVTKTLKIRPLKRKKVEEARYREEKRRIFYDEDEEDSTEMTWDD